MTKNIFKKRNLINRIAMFILISFFSYVLLARYFFLDMTKNYRFSVGELIEISAASRTSDRYAEFKIKTHNNIILATDSFPSDSTSYYQSKIGGRFLVKMHRNYWIDKIFGTYKLYISAPAPQNIQIPIEGWKERPEWSPKK